MRRVPKLTKGKIRIRIHWEHALRKLLQPDRQLWRAFRIRLPFKSRLYNTYIDPLDVLEGVLVLPPVQYESQDRPSFRRVKILEEVL